MDAPDKVFSPDTMQPPNALISYARRLLTWRILLIATLALAVGMRFYGLAWDAGFSYTPHPDERAILDRVINISPPGLGDIGLLLDAERSAWNPGWFNYGSLPLYVLKIAQILTSPLLGDGGSDIREIGRAVSGLADVATVLAVFGVATLVFDRRTGLLAAALTAFAVIHIQLSHFFAVDTLQAMLTVAALYFMVKIARDGRMRDSLLAGALVGLGLATKASQIPIVAPFVIAHLMFAFGLNGKPSEAAFDRRFKAALWALVGGIAVAAIALMLAQPYMLLDWNTFYSHVSEQSEMIRGIRDYPYTRQYADTTPYLYHIRQLAVWGYGFPLGIVAWSGLLYVSLRGLRMKLGAAYLLVGWALPAAILLVSQGAIALGAAAAIALLALLATLPVRSKSAQLEVLLLCWVAPYFLVTGAFHVKFMRYMLPIAPLLTIFGARMLMAIWDSAIPYRKALRPLVGVAIALVLASTAFYAFAYLNGVYSQKHTGARAAEWLNANVSAGAFILKEHWEESLPNLRSDFTSFDLPMYEDDRPGKTALIADMLADADYLVFFSNRLYGTIPRLPERYPTTSEYYRLLFSNLLGYTLVNAQVSYPSLFGIEFADDTFGRPNLPSPGTLVAYNSAPSGSQSDYAPPLTLNLGYADESFSVYDHPKVMILENTGRMQAAEIRSLLERNVPAGTPAASSEPALGLMYSPEDAAIQRQGDSWTDIIHPNSWTNRLPILAWLGALELIALVALPLTFIIFRPLPDRGFLFAKALGILLVGLGVWLLASLQWMAFSRTSIALTIALMTLVSLVVLVAKWQEISCFVRRRWPTLLVAELIFLSAFLVFVVVRMANPDLWHPYRGGEKPMDFAYLNAVLRSTIMPPYDPWFAGGYLNYYYWGQFLTAMLIKATAIAPTIAFNLAIPTFFSLTVGGAYTIVYNLVEAARHRLPSQPAFPIGRSERQAPFAPGLSKDELDKHTNPKGNSTPSHSNGGATTEAPIRPSIGGDDTRRYFHWTPILVGLVGVAFVTVLGNLDGAIQAGQGIANMLQGQPFDEFDFWRSSRMMPPDPPGFEITEFPFFTFLFADLHAHMMAIPFTLLAMGLSLAIVFAAADRANALPSQVAKVRIEEILRLVFLGIGVGALAPLNTWDVPTYLIVASASILFAEFLAHGGLGLVMLIRTGVKFVLMAGVGFAAFLPYHLSGETFYNSLQATTNTTTLWQFLAISGLFVFIVGTFVVDELADGARRWGTALCRKLAHLRTVLGGGDGEAVSVLWLIGLIAGALLAGLALTAAFTGIAGSAVPFVVALAALVAAAGVGALFQNRPDIAQLGFVLILALVSLSLVIGLDFFRVEGDIDRLNSIFKFYLQVWAMLGVVSAYLLWRLFRVRRSFLPHIAFVRRAWLAVLAILILSASIYPVMGTRDRLRDRFEGNVTPLTLDGVAFIEPSEYRDPEGVVDLAADYEGVWWLNRNIEGAPIVLEAVTPSYRWGGRVSVYTGLPSIVGWQWHQEQQRFGYRWNVPHRINDVETIYQTQDAQRALTLMRKYGVKYIYLGQLERMYFPGGMSKFDDAMGGALEKVFDNGKTKIYRLKDAP